MKWQCSDSPNLQRHMPVQDKVKSNNSSTSLGRGLDGRGEKDKHNQATSSVRLSRLDNRIAASWNEQQEIYPPPRVQHEASIVHATRSAVSAE
jgi:hypothetical protein